MSATGFQIDWLKERFRYDNAARNQEVEKYFLHHFRNHEKLNIVDIGSGTGANCLYFIERLFKNQTWTLVEKDEALCEATIDRIGRFLQDYNFFYTFENNVFRIKAWESRVKITILNASFFELKNIIDLEEIDIVMAAAVFDVLTFGQFEKAVSPILENKIPIFSTMNYHAMRFQPITPLDLKYVNAYEDHMLREQKEGRAMGPECSKLMEAFFKNNNLNIVKGKSQWKLNNQARKMHGFILGFMEKSIKGNLENGSEEFDHWLLEKREISKGRELEIEVDHVDYFVR